MRAIHFLPKKFLCFRFSVRLATSLFCFISVIGCQKNSGTQNSTSSSVSPGQNDGPGGQAQPFPGGKDQPVSSPQNEPISANGYFISGTGTAIRRIPTHISLSLRQEGAVDNRLTLRITLGLFGGVTLQSDQVSLDPASGRFSSSISPTTALRVEGVIQEGSLKNLTLVGPYSGQLSFQSTQENGLLTPAQITGSIRIKGPSSKKSTLGYLTIYPQYQTIPSQGESDLPALPSLSASLVVPVLGINSGVVFTNVKYDPLKARLDLDLANNQRISFLNLNESTAGSPTKYPLMKGLALQGATVVSELELQLDSNENGHPSLDGDDERVSFIGQLIFPGGDSASIDIQATLEPTGLSSTNTVDGYFPVFSGRSLKIKVCENGQGRARLNLDLVGINPLSGKVYFNQNAGAQKTEMLGQVEGNWETISGTLRSAVPTEHPTQVKLKKLALSKGQKRQDCLP